MTDATVEATVDLAVIAHDEGIVRERSGAEVLAVVKADGYGHGAVPVARASLRAGAVEIGVATIAEALALRAAGITAPVIAWQHTPRGDFAAAVRAGVEIVVSTPRQLTALVGAASDLGRSAEVGVKVDTGLGRGGVGPQERASTLDLLARSCAKASVRFRTVMSHLACAEEPAHPGKDEQARRLEDSVQGLRRARLFPQGTHLANSAAALTRTDLAGAMVRAEIALYGRTSMPDLGDFGLIPAMTLSAEVSLVKRVRAGQGVSYGHTWRAPKDSVVALLPAGTSMGSQAGCPTASRSGSRGAATAASGGSAWTSSPSTLGRTAGASRRGIARCSSAPARGEPIALEWARLCGTIDYEILTRVRGRRIRRYVKAPPPAGSRADAARSFEDPGEEADR